MSLVDLILKADLINPQFEGYRLSLDHLPLFATHLEAEQNVCDTFLSSAQYSYQHMKAFGSHNHLVLDPYNKDHIYWVAQNGSVIHANTANCYSTVTPDSVFRLPIVDSAQESDTSPPEGATPDTTPSLASSTFSFTSDSLAVVCDGNATLYLLDTGNRTEPIQQWKILHKFPRGESSDDNVRSLLLDSIICTNDGVRQVHCLVYHIESYNTDDEDGSETSAERSVLTTVSLHVTDADSYSVVRYVTLHGTVCPDYASLHRDGSHVVLCSAQPYLLFHDSTKPVVQPASESGTESKATDQAAYTWHETDEDVNVTFDLDHILVRSDVTCKLTSTLIDLSVKGAGSVLEGSLAHKITVEESTWYIDKNRLELVLSKAEPGTNWTEVVTGDARGEKVDQPPPMQDLSKMFDSKPAYNTQELEDCDINTSEHAVLMHINLNSHQTTHMVNLSHRQFLFSTTRTDDHPGILCLRHDVDGVAWQPTDVIQTGISPWEHTATFNALGYVSASKQNKKFMACDSSCNYSLIADFNRHLYIYRQNNSLLTPIRNRKSGQNVSSIAKQQLITLESTDDIVGLCATNSVIAVLCKDVLYVIKVDS